MCLSSYRYCWFFPKNLAQNKLGSASGVCVGQMLRINHTMRSLSLADNGFDDITGSDVIEALEVGTVIKIL